MHIKILLIAVVLVAVLSTGLAEAAGPRERSLTIATGRVAPHALRIESGTKVTWRNMDSVARTVVVEKYVGKDGKESDPKVRSEALAKYERGTGKTVAAFSHVFVDAGTYRYKLAGSSGAYTIVVDAPKVAKAPSQSPTATGTPRPPKPTATPTATPKVVGPAAIATVGPWPPAELPANWQRGYCGGWEAQRLSSSSVRLTGECVFPSGGFTVKMAPRQLGGAVMLVDKLMLAPTGSAATVVETVPVSLVVAAGPDRSDVVVMPDRVRVPIVAAPTATPVTPTATPVEPTATPEATATAP